MVERQTLRTDGARINTSLTNISETLMPQLIDPGELQSGAEENCDSTSDWRSVQRKHLTLSLNEIASEVTTALQEAGLTMPVFL